MEKLVPTYDLESFRSAAAHIAITVAALQGAASIGYSRDDITRVIHVMKKSHFYKSMTSYQNHREWQDVYHVPHGGQVIYIKFVADVISDFRLLSFKEK